MKKPHYVLILLFLLISCSKNDTSTSGNSTQNGVLLKKVIYTEYGGSIYEYNFTYNGNKLTSQNITNNNLSDVYLYTYTGNLITKTEEYLNGELYETADLTYDNNELIMKVITKEIGKITILYSQNGDGTISYNLFSTINGGSESGKLYYKNENLVKWENKDYTITFFYDSKNNPYKNILGWNKLINLDHLDTSFSKNNLTETGWTGLFEGNTTISYTYNSNGYPIECKSYASDGTTVDYTEEYFY